ncbi:MAG: SGNH/GDSL hydrolase family protein, partial [Acidimicrobiales bacterium]
ADTMIDGGCFFTTPEPDGPGLALHTSYDGSQLDAAVSVLRAHPDQVNPITVSIGGIDAADVIAETCNFDASCVARSGLRDELGRDLDRVLEGLQAAAPRAQIILVAFYNPFTVDVPTSDRLWHRHYTTALKAAAARHGARIADVSGLLDEHDVCDLTFLCSSGDPHPTDLGYRLIADEVFEAAGYE